MARFMAIHTISGLTEERFRAALDQVNKWRPDRRTTILKVYCNLSEGRMVSECEAPEQSQFEEWLKSVDWPYDSIHRVDLVHQVGNIWKL